MIDPERFRSWPWTFGMVIASVATPSWSLRIAMLAVGWLALWLDIRQERRACPTKN